MHLISFSQTIIILPKTSDIKIAPACALFVLLFATLVCCQPTELIWGFCCFINFPILPPSQNSYQGEMVATSEHLLSDLALVLSGAGGSNPLHVAGLVSLVNLESSETFVGGVFGQPVSASDHIVHGMRCCRSDWPGFCLFCCFQLSCETTELIQGFFCFINFPISHPHAHAPTLTGISLKRFALGFYKKNRSRLIRPHTPIYQYPQLNPYHTLRSICRTSSNPPPAAPMTSC